MARAEEVVDGFYGIEGFGRDFNENGVPVAHGAVPEAGQLEGTQLATLG